MIWFFLLQLHLQPTLAGKKLKVQYRILLDLWVQFLKTDAKNMKIRYVNTFFLKILINLWKKKYLHISNFFREPTNYWQGSLDKKLQVKFVSVLEISATPLDLINSIWFWHFCAHFWHFLDLLRRSGKYVVLDICSYLSMYSLTSQWQILKLYFLMANST